jgi:hypothetical protein
MASPRGSESEPTGNGSIVAGPVTAALLALAALGLLGLLWQAMCTVPGVTWNAPRLAPSFALAHGLPFYALRPSGAQLGWVYGPIFPLWYWPITACSNLTTALMIAGLWNFVSLLAPIYLVLRVVLEKHARLAAMMTLVGGALLVANWVTQTTLFYVHVDALCIAWGLVAASALHRAVERGSRLAWHAAALALVLAVWTKQLAIMLVPATIAWLWRERGRNEVGRWLKLLVMHGGVTTLIFFAVFGPEELWFNLWFFPARNPSHLEWSVFGARVGQLLAGGWLWWLAAGLGWRWARSRGTIPGGAASLVRLLAWIAVWEIPVGLSAAMKVGGGNNSFHALNYGLVAGLVAASAWIAARTAGAGEARLRRQAWLACAVLAIVGIAAGYKFALRREAVWRPDRGQEEMLAYARRHPGKLYLPWNPLITIISDGKIYPFDDALLCLWRAGLAPPRDAIRRAMPAGAEVLYQASNQSRFALTYLEDDRTAPVPLKAP